MTSPSRSSSPISSPSRSMSSPSRSMSSPSRSSFSSIASPSKSSTFSADALSGLNDDLKPDFLKPEAAAASRSSFAAATCWAVCSGFFILPSSPSVSLPSNRSRRESSTSCVNTILHCQTSLFRRHTHHLSQISSTTRTWLLKTSALILPEYAFKLL